MTSAVSVQDVSKRFRLYHEKYSSLKERVIHLNRVPYEDFWALSEVSFDIQEGETVGLLGHNGSGKSTLLKCVAGILQPTSGQIVTKGRLAALLELGAGFHPDLTGRENVFLNAALLGMPRKEVAKRFDEIVAFAELEQFIDNQVKHYSSGMYVRLGFAVAVNMDPEILLVDEVLAVGDESFQRKCLDRVRQFQKEGRTIVFVTHAADLVRQICDRAAVLDHGRLVEMSTPGQAVRTFREHLLQGEGFEGSELHGNGTVQLAKEELANYHARITGVHMIYPRPDREHLLPGEPLTVQVDYEASEVLEDVVFGIAIYDMQGRDVYAAHSKRLDVQIDRIEGKGRAEFRFGSVHLLDGDYLVSLAIQSGDEGTIYDWKEQQYRFSVMNPTRTLGLVHLPVEFVVSQGEQVAP